MTHEILEAIKKSLPEVQMAALREELQKAAKVDGLEDLITQNNKKIKELENIKYNLEAELKRHAGITERVEKVKEDERNLEIEKLKYQLQAEKDSNAKVRELVSQVFRNTTVREHIYKQVPNPAFNGDIYNPSINISETKNIDMD